MSELKCIGRTDSLGDPHEFGPHVSFVYRIPGSANHTITLEEPEAEKLFHALKAALWSYTTLPAPPADQKDEPRSFFGPTHLDSNIREEVMPNIAAGAERAAREADNATPRPAHSPAGADLAKGEA